MIYQPFEEFALGDRVWNRTRLGTIIRFTSFRGLACAAVKFDKSDLTLDVFLSALHLAQPGDSLPTPRVTFHYRAGDPSVWQGDQYSGRAGLGGRHS